MGESIVRVGLVEDQALVREGIKNILNQQSRIQVMFEAETGYEVPSRLRGIESKPDLLLIDLSLPPQGHQRYSGFDLTRELREHFPAVRMLILTVQDDPATIGELIREGAHGFLSKSCAPTELFQAIFDIAEKGAYMTERTLQALRRNVKQRPNASSVQVQPLTAREREVLQLICEELTAEEIGERLFISRKTVNGHRNNLLQKTGARNINGLVMYAVRHGIVSLT